MPDVKAGDVRTVRTRRRSTADAGGQGRRRAGRAAGPSDAAGDPTLPLEPPAGAPGGVTDWALEACCLLALVAVPLAVAPWLTVPYDVPQVNFLRVLVGLGALAAAAGWWWGKGRSRHGQHGQRGTPPAGLLPIIRYAVLGYGGAQLLSTAFSIHPEVSFWGTYPDQHGTYAALQLTFLALFLLIALGLRRSTQRLRLAAALSLSGSAVSIVGIVQALGYDPLRTVGAGDRIISTLGNPIYVGDLLVVTIPFAAVLCALGIRGIHHKDTKTQRRELARGDAAPVTAASQWQHRDWCAWLIPGMSFGGLVVQIAAMVLTQSRGPLVGLGVGVVVLLGLAARFLSRGERVALVGVLGAAAGAALVLVQALPSPAGTGSVEATAQRFGVGLVVRSANPIASAVSSSVSNLELTVQPDRLSSGRTILWEMSVDAIVRRPWVDFAPDRSPLVRHAFGYGPEATRVVAGVVYPSAFREYEGGIIWAPHNIVLHLLLEVGWLGLLAFLLLVGSCLLAAWQWLRRTRAGAGSAIAASEGIGAELGTRNQELGTRKSVVPVSEEVVVGRWLAIAAAAAITGHMAEQMTGVPVAAAEPAFWTAMGLAAGGALTARTGMPWHRRRPALVAGGLAGIALVFIGATALAAETTAVAGLRALAQREAAGAERRLTEATKITPWPAYYQLLLGGVYADLAQRAQNPELAHRLLRASAAGFDQVLRSDPWNVIVRLNRAKVGTLLGIRDEQERARTRRAFQELLALDRRNDELVLEFANALILWSEPRAALELLDTSLAGFAPPYQPPMYRAMALADLGRTEEALASFDRALVLAPVEMWESIRRARELVADSETASSQAR